MTTANEALFHAALRHHVQLLRFTKGEARRAVALIQGADDELVRALQGGLTDFGAGRVRGLLNDLGALRGIMFDRLKGTLGRSMGELAQMEAQWEGKAIEGSVPVDLTLNSVPSALLKGVVSRPIQGITLDGWLDGMRQADVRRINQQVQLGVLEGLPVPQIVRRVRDILPITQRDATAVVRTAVNNVSNGAREEVWKANSDIISGLRWTATLDGRTSPVCRARDGQVFPADSGPRPPAHFNCRSLMVATIDGIGVVGERPTVRDTRTRAKREVDFREQARQQAGGAWKGMSEQQRRAAIRDVREKWAAENIGRMPAATTYDEWLRKQPGSFQDEVLGREKGDMFRKGMKLDQFVDERGREYTLAELRAQNAGDAVNVMQPGIGLKAKAYLQQGLDNATILDKLKTEFPEANTTAASLASYKVELKKLGVLDDLKGAGIDNALAGGALGVKSLVDMVDGSLPANLKHAVGGQWANVVQSLDGAPGAYAHYKAGKGVELSAEKLSAIPTTQAKQVVAHELGHLLHKQHDLGFTAFKEADLFSLASALDAVDKKAYAYYLAHKDELIAEVIAQALSPSPLTSQGLSAKRFREVFAPAIEDVKKSIANKWPTPAAGTPPPPPSPPTQPMQVAGKHASPYSLAKALAQQGLDEDAIKAALFAEFPGTGVGSGHAYVSNDLSLDMDVWKKSGQLPTKTAGPTVVATPAPVATPVPPPATVAAQAPQAASAAPSAVKVSGGKLKEEGLKLFQKGVLGNDDVVQQLKAMFPQNVDDIKYANVASWKTNWKKSDPAAFAQAEALAKQGGAKVATTGPQAQPKLAGQQLGPHASNALTDLKQVASAGGGWNDAMKVLTKYFGATADPAKGQDLWELAMYEVQTGTSVSKPYLNAAYSATAKGPTPSAQPQVPTSVTTTKASYDADKSAFDALTAKWAPAQKSAFEVWAEKMALYDDPDMAENAVKVKFGVAGLSDATKQMFQQALQPWKILGEFEQNLADAVLDAAKNPLVSGDMLPGKWQKALDAIKTHLLAHGKVTQAQLDDLIFSSLGKDLSNAQAKALKTLAEKDAGIAPPTKAPPQTFANSYSAQQAKQAAIDMSPSRPATTPREGTPPPPRFTRDQHRAAVEKWAQKSDTVKLDVANARQRKAGLEELTPEEYSAIRRYTGGAFREINRALRNGEYASDMHLQAYVDAAQSGLRKMPKHSGQVARGITLDAGRLQQFLATHREGMVVDDHAFISTSYGDRAAFSGNVYMHIKNPRSAVKVQDYSYYDHEREVLFPPGLQFKVVRVEKKNHVYEVELEEV